MVSLDSPRRLLALLGDPHRDRPAVHIAGTKGKGSTAAMLERILRQAGYRTGLFTSPHLVSLRERVRVDGEPIPPQALAHLVERLEPVILGMRETGGLNPCTFFEAYLGLAALHFAAERVDIALYETGLGGRLDATNLVTPRVSAITTIGFDHMAILGHTLDAIAREKAGIAKAGVPLVVAREQPEAALAAIREVAAGAGAPVVFGPQVARRDPPRKAAVDAGGQVVRPQDVFEVSGGGELRCSLLGAHQATNLGVALGVLEQLAPRGYTIRQEQLEAALGDVCWPGRLDIRAAQPWLVFDCAHNGDSALALARALPEYLDYGRLALVVGMSEDKDVAAFARGLAGLEAHVILTRAQIERALPAQDLRARAAGAWDEAEIAEDVETALRRASEVAGREGAVCMTGSFYVVGEAMERRGMEP